jgi:VanZ family protein
VITDRIAPAVRLTGWVCVVVVAFLSLLPADHMVRTDLSGHVEHVTAYAGTAFFLQLGYPRRCWRNIAMLVAYAAVLECLQVFSPGRHAAVEDWMASSTGVLIGSAAALLAGPVFRRLLPASAA